MAFISQLFYKTTNLMPRKEIVRTCKEIGKELGRDSKSSDSIDLNKFRQLLAKSVGKKKADKIVIADDFETFKKYTKELGIDDNTSEVYFMSSKSAVLANPKDNTVLLSLRTSGTEMAEALNLATHELEHVLFRSLSPRAALEKIYIKLRGSKYMDKILQKYGQLINEKSFDMQNGLLSKSQFEDLSPIGGYTNQLLNIEGLLKQMNISSYKTFRTDLDSLVSDLLEKKNPKINIKILNAMRAVLKDESRAYKSGGAVERFWTEAQGKVNPNANKSEMFAMLYDETLPSIRKALWKQRIEYLKNIFKIGQ